MLRHGLDNLTRGLALVAGGLLCGLTGLVCLDVAARYFTWFAMPWSLDVAEYLLYAITFLAAPWVLRTGGHIKVDLVVERLPAGGRRRTARVAAVVGMVTCGSLLYFSCRVWWASFRSGTMVYETFVFPEWWLFSLAPPIFAVLTACYLHGLFGNAPVTGTDPDSKPT